MVDQLKSFVGVQITTHFNSSPSTLFYLPFLYPRTSIGMKGVFICFEPVETWFVLRFDEKSDDRSFEIVRRLPNYYTF